MNEELFDFVLLSFVSLFTIINPIGVAPVYIAMTTELSREESRRMALRGSLTALFILAAFGLTGQFILEFFSISIHSLRIVGGILLFIIGFDMLQARLTRTRHDEESTSEYINDNSITPLGIPIIAGPGGITTMILLTNDATDTLSLIAVFGAMLLVVGFTHLTLISSERIMSWMGDSGNKVFMRLMGLIVMVIAVEFFFAGLGPKLAEILP